MRRALLGLTMLLGTAACAPGALSFDAGAGPDGTPERVHTIRGALLRGDGAAALARVAEKDAGSGDRLLRTMERGQVALYAGDLRKAAQYLDEAHWMVQGRATRSLTNGAAALVTSDKALPYQPGSTEQAMLHYYGARTWLAQGNVQEATVDIRRLSALLQRIHGTDEALPPELTASLHEVAAAFYAAAGDAADADVAARLAARALGDSVVADASCPECGTVVVLAERGLVAQKASRGLSLAIANGDLAAISSKRNDPTSLESLAAAVDRATRPVGCGWSRRAVCGWERRDITDGPFTVVSIAWPSLSAPRTASGPFRLSIGEHAVDVPMGVSVSEGVAEDFARGAPGRIARAVARTAVRQSLVEAGNEAMEKSREDKKHKDKWRAAGIAAWLAAGASSWSERADTRGWSLLPDELVVHRVQVPAGEYVVRRGGPDGAIHSTVQVRRGGTTVVAVREWELYK
jgi:hypothetical protein